MSRSRSLDEERRLFDKAAQDYLRYLRTKHPEHFMEAPAQGTQRKITLASLAVVQAVRPRCSTSTNC